MIFSFRAGSFFTAVFLFLAVGPCPVHFWDVWTSKVTDLSLIAPSMRILSFTLYILGVCIRPRIGTGRLGGGRMRTATISLALRASARFNASSTVVAS